MSAIPAEIEAAAAYLSSLPAEEREAKLRAIKNLAIVRAPDENVELPPPIRNLGEYLDHKIELPPMLVGPGQIARGAVTALIARAGKGKTTMTLNRVLRWAAGKPMFDDLPNVMVPAHPLKALIIENEGAPGFFQEKLQLMFDSQHLSPEERDLVRENVAVWGEGGWPRIKLDDQATYDLVRRGVEQFEPDLVMMEPFRSLWGGDENSATEMTNLMDRIATIASEYKVGVLLTHHERKAGAGEDGEEMSAGRGSTVLEGEAAVMERWKHIKGEQSELRWVKWRFGKPSAPVRMRFDYETWTYEYVTAESGRREILDVLIDQKGGFMTASDIASELDESVNRVRRLLNELADDDEVSTARSLQTGAGSTGKRYRIALTEDQATGLEI